MVRASLYQVSEAAPWWTNIQQPFPFQVEARGLMVSALDSGSGGPGSSPGRGHCVVFLGKTLYSHSASTNGYQQMCYGLTSHPGGSSNTPCRFMLRKPELSTDPMGPYTTLLTTFPSKTWIQNIRYRPSPVVVSLSSYYLFVRKFRGKNYLWTFRPVSDETTRLSRTLTGENSICAITYVT